MSQRQCGAFHDIKPTEEAPDRGTCTGSLRDEEEAHLRSLEAESSQPNDAGASLAVAAAAYLGGVLELLGLLALTLTWAPYYVLMARLMS